MTSNTDRKYCNVCKKKLNLLPLKCKCNDYFCEKHFFFSSHDCPYNFKQEYDSNSLFDCKSVENKIKKI